MSHGRTDVKSEIEAILTGLSTTGARVYVDRFYPLADDDFPCLVVNANTDEVDLVRSNLNRIWRNFRLDVVAYGQRTSGLVAVLETINSEVDAALSGATLTGIQTIWPDSCELSTDPDGEQPVGTLTKTYRVGYITENNGDIA